MANSAYAYDVEITPNFFSVTFINVNDYLSKMKDVQFGIDKLSDILDILNTVESHEFYLHDDDDSQLFSLLSFINVKRDMFGFNNNRYDKLMMAAFMMNYKRFKNCRLFIKHLHNISARIIKNMKSKDDFYKDEVIVTLNNYRHVYRDIDLMSIFALDKCMKSLKQTSINLCWWNLLEWVIPPICDIDRHYYENDNFYKTIPNDKLTKLITVWDRFVPKEYIPYMMVYNKNDVFICCEMIRQNMDEVKLRYNIAYKYQVNVLSSSRSNIADKLIEKFYSNLTGLDRKQFIHLRTERRGIKLKDCIFPFIKFESIELTNLLNELKTITITATKGELNHSVTFGGTTYTLGTGGLHSVDNPGIFIATDAVSIRDADGTSFYPNLLRHHNIHPKHLNNDAWNKLISIVIDERVEAKHTGDTTTANALKIVVNSGGFGKMGFQFSFMYDRKAMMEVTVNGQLFLLMLIEALTLIGVQVISANTDGIVSLIPKELEDEYYRICKEWEVKTKIDLEFTEYSKYIRRDVNNYLTLKPNGKYKFKGGLNPNMYKEDLTKGFNSPIVAKAVGGFFLNDIPVMDTLRNCNNILMFCKTQNINRDYRLTLTYVKDGKTIVEEIQRYVRFFVSNRGAVLRKVKVTKNADGEEIDKYAGICAGQTVTILNSLTDSPVEELDIDYAYYYNEAYSIINPIKLGISSKNKKALKKNFGAYSNLFDN